VSIFLELLKRRTPNVPKRTRSILAMATLLGLAALLPPAASAAESLLFEVRELTNVNPPFSRNVYACPLCTEEQFALVVAPSGFEKAPGKLFLPSFATANLPTPPPGVAPGLDLVPDIPGDDFIFIAQVLTAQPVGFDPVFGFLAVASVQRDTLFRYDAGEVVHEVSDTQGNTFQLFSFGLDLLDSIDVSQVGALAGLPYPPGWTYSSHVLGEDRWVSSEGLAGVFAQGQQASWQRLEPGFSVGVDIQPGNDTSPINPSGRGVTPVAILGSDSFDVADVDVTTLAFGPGAAPLAHRNGPHVKDVNGDDLDDLLAHFRTQDAGVASGDDAVCVTGETLAGEPFLGCDLVTTVPR
jgi:hypothetical protein